LRSVVSGGTDAVRFSPLTVTVTVTESILEARPFYIRTGRSVVAAGESVVERLS
jgi:hypothetical protein